MFLSLFFSLYIVLHHFSFFFIFLSACLLFNSLLLCTITPPHTPIHIALLLANKPTKKMESQDPKAASLILKFKEAAKAAEEDYEYSDDDEDDDNEEEEEEEVAGFRLIGVERNGEVVKKKKLVVSDTGSGKKRANVTGGGGGGGMAAVCCQVEKCGTDLKEVKRYYRRHKVCEVHAKSPLVVVGGIRQRFCQQCSRFHELSEFDEMRRSCRSRLAGHNERRRKLSSETHREAASSHEGDRITIATARPGKHIQFH